MTAPNIVNVSTIIGKTSGLDVTTETQAIVTNSAASGKVYKINSLLVSNIDGSNAADITANVSTTSGDFYLASTITVPADATLVVVSKETALYLEESSSIMLLASANSDLQAVCSYEEIS